MNPSWIVAGVGVATLLFQAIGFVYVTRNHLWHLQKSLDRIELSLIGLINRVARLEGRLQQETHVA